PSEVTHMGHQLRRDPRHRLAGGDQVTFEPPSHVPAILDCPQPLLAEPGGPLHQLQMVVCRDANGFRIPLSTHLVNSDRGVGALVRVDTDDHYTVNFVLRRVAQYTGDTAALQRTQSGAAQMARDKVSSVRRQGKWLAAIDADTYHHPRSRDRTHRRRRRRVRRT